MYVYTNTFFTSFSLLPLSPAGLVLFQTVSSNAWEIIGHPFHHGITEINLLLEQSTANSHRNPVTWGIIPQLIAFTLSSSLFTTA